MTFLEKLANGYFTLRLAHIKDWSPFRIGALGVVTLLRMQEVNQSVGTLQHRRYTEYLPLLAAPVIAGDHFVAEQPGFVLYNLTDGITSTELKGWFTRWLMSQCVNNATTVLVWEKHKQSRSGRDLVAPVLSFILVTPLLVIATFIGNWCEIGNAAAIIISILTRVYLLSQRRHARDTHAAAPKDERKENPRKTLCIVRSDGKMVTCKAPESVLQTFVKNSEVKHPKVYLYARWLCWLALGIHVGILGMCSLPTQIYTVSLLALSTWWFTSDTPSDIRREHKKNFAGHGTSVFTLPFNLDWCVKQNNPPKMAVAHDGETVNRDKRLIAWAYLGLDESEEAAMDRWNLFPKNESWRNEYKTLKKAEEDTINEKFPHMPQAQASNPCPEMPTTLSTTVRT
jgi:hypothetical protein